MSTPDDNPFSHYVDLAQPRLGTEVVYATDDFFADKSRLISPAEPVFIDGKFDDHGKWMDGWESRRKRTPGHDHCIVRLGVPGIVRGVDIDTRHFTGNYPPQASIEACTSDDEIPCDEAGWTEIVPTVDLHGNSHQYVAVNNDAQFTHLKLHIYPDGGVARLRVYGEIRPDWSKFDRTTPIDLLALEHGGRALACNDEHFGTMRNLNAPGRGVNMGDGWETARRRVPGNDWVVLALGHAGVVSSIEVDTAHFKGNYPDRVMIQAALFDGDDDAAVAASADWPVLLEESKLTMDAQHHFEDGLEAFGPVSHVRMNIYPDGGVSRLRINGVLADV